MKKRKKIKIQTDQHGRDYIKESCFVGGKMKFKKGYVIDGITEEDFCEKNTTDIDHLRNGEYWLITTEKQTYDFCDKSNMQEQDLSDVKFEDFPF